MSPYLCAMADATVIPFEETGKFSRLFLDYVNGKESLRPFYSFSPDVAGYQKASAAFSYDESKRALVASVIRKQYGSCEVPGELLKKFELKGTATVTTGHQLCLFTGPLYFVYKILSTIRLAEKMEQESGRPVVPVYWMASEDHDFEEISSVNLFGKTLKWVDPVGGPVGRLGVASMQLQLEELKQLIGVGENAGKLVKLLEEAYAPGKKLAEATRLLVHKLFGGKILVLEPDDAELKRLFIPYFKEDIFQNTAFTLVNASIEKLRALGYEAQVNPREINIFYLGISFRERISFENGKYKVLNTGISFTKEELEKELLDHPERFSPNVVLRPLFQQFLLPNLAYVGGPGELAYWLEYRDFFDRSKIFFPLLQPRHSVLLLDKHLNEKMVKLGLSARDFFQDEESLVNQFIENRSGDEVSLESEKQNLRELLVNIVEKAKTIDPTLEKAAIAEIQKMTNGLDALQAKMLKAKKQKEEVSVSQIRKIHGKLFPDGILQERYENFIPQYLESGENFFSGLSQEFNFPVTGILVL